MQNTTQRKIIYALKESSSHLSGEDISRRFNISRAAIWKYMQELRRIGYRIDAVPHLGYKLVGVPDKLLPQEIQYNLKTQTIAQDILYLDQTESTMDKAFELGMKGVDEGVVVIAESQKNGRGRMGRTWISPKGKGIYFSLILKPPFSGMDISKLTLLSAVALSEAVEKVVGINAQIKWPNDLLVNGKKLAGILTEMRAEVDRVDFVVVGVGINVNNTNTQLIDEATSLKELTGKKISRIELLQVIFEILEKWYMHVIDEGFSSMFDQWRKRSSTLGRRIRLNDTKGVCEGEAIDIDEHGGLLIKQDSGEVICKMAGDVTFSRARTV